MADVLKEREMLTKARATKLTKRALQTAAMVQTGLNGMSLLEETKDENAVAVAAALGKEGNEGRVLQNPSALGVPAVQNAPHTHAPGGRAAGPQPGPHATVAWPGASQGPPAPSDAMGK
jgi:hypothetical protein